MAHNLLTATSIAVSAIGNIILWSGFFAPVPQTFLIWGGGGSVLAGMLLAIFAANCRGD